MRNIEFCSPVRLQSCTSTSVSIVDLILLFCQCDSFLSLPMPLFSPATCFACLLGCLPFAYFFLFPLSPISFLLLSPGSLDFLQMGLAGIVISIYRISFHSVFLSILAHSMFFSGLLFFTILLLFSFLLLEVLTCT